MRFSLTRNPITVSSEPSPGAGGFVTFDGRVRDNADGQSVLRLEYEAFDNMALAEGQKLVEEAVSRFELVDADVVHRLGLLEVGESAVVITVAAPHRREAFAACEWIIDQLKWRVPIWKKEHYASGESEWVMAQASHGEANVGLYDRQIRMPEIRAEGQQKIGAASVLLVGLGGLGAAVLPALAGAGVGRLVLVDADTVDATNLHRQTIYRRSDVGRGKAERAARFAKELNPSVNVAAVPEMLDAANAERLVQSCDIVVDGTDSLATKFLLNATCKRLGKTLVTASIHGFEGQVFTVTPDGPCLQCLFPETPTDGCVDTCAVNGTVSVVPAFFGVLQANEVVQALIGGHVLRDELLLFDLASKSMTKLRRSQRPGCRGCQGEFVIDPPDWEVDTVDEVQARHPDLQVVDIRELDEEPDAPIGSTRIPIGEWAGQVPEVPTLFICASGARSGRLVVDMLSRGVTNVYSLRGGVHGMVGQK